LVFDLFVSPLSNKEREQYYRDSLVVARLFDIPESLIPPTYADFQCYMSNMLESDVISVSDAAHDIGRELFSPSLEGTLLFLLSVTGIGLLPERLRLEFGFQWSFRRQAWLFRIAAASRRVRKYTPTVLCSSPVATFSHLRTLVRS
jgi:uncharacterized protein (DUF2236 family)